MPYVTSIERFAMQEGEQRGIEIGEQRGIEIGEGRGIEIGEIHAYEKMLRMEPTPLEVLKKMTNDELRRLSQEPEAKLLR